jgi:protein-disulfide isomerase
MVHGLQGEYIGRVEFVRTNILDKTTFELQERYGFTATPEFFLIDSQGKVLGYWDENVTLDGLRAAFDEALAGVTVE